MSVLRLKGMGLYKRFSAWEGEEMRRDKIEINKAVKREEDLSVMDIIFFKVAVNYLVNILQIP